MALSAKCVKARPTMHPFLLQCFTETDSVSKIHRYLVNKCKQPATLASWWMCLRRRTEPGAVILFLRLCLASMAAGSCAHARARALALQPVMHTFLNVFFLFNCCLIEASAKITPSASRPH